uniref:PAXX non-homologous end joining factor n=1 Tax=Astyanax mexicanus TaxID=7994 RepID=A0A3B1JHX8_ASTMX
MDQTDSQPKTVLGTLIDRKDRSKYVCFTQRRAGGLSLGLSNGEDVWKADVSEESLSQMKKSFSLKSTEDYALKLKGACRSGSAFVSLQEDGAVLHLDSEPADLNVSLSKLTDLEGRSELKDLLFKMADSLTQLDAAGATPTSSPIKSLQKKGTGNTPEASVQLQVLSRCQVFKKSIKLRTVANALLHPQQLLQYTTERERERERERKRWREKELTRENGRE